MAWFDHKITVTFINDATNETIGVTQIPPNDLPESFELETTMHLGDSSWIVADVVPKNRVEYSKSKKLTLRLNQVLSVDPQTILASLPTICDYIPGLGNQALTDQELILHEDDWQQFEFVSRQLVSEIDQEIESIRQIYAHESVGVGFRKLHVRKLIKKSIACDFTLSDIMEILGIQAASNGVTYQRATSQIEAGFSITAPDGLRLYGLTENSTISVLAIAEEVLEHPPEQSIVALQSLASKFDLELLHWCTCRRASGTDPGFRRLFSNF
jgi:hypothetical protein